jgi:phosphomannomutase
MEKSIFKAYDIRGKYPREINENVVEKIAIALTYHFKKGEIIVGHDARLSSPKLYKAVIGAIKKENPKLSIIKLGLITTPLLYFLVNRVGATAGIVVTASHNPKEYNGLKVVGRDAEPLNGKEIWKLVQKHGLDK